MYMCVAQACACWHHVGAHMCDCTGTDVGMRVEARGRCRHWAPSSTTLLRRPLSLNPELCSANGATSSAQDPLALSSHVYGGTGIQILAPGFAWQVLHPLSHPSSSRTPFSTGRRQQGPRERSEGRLAEGRWVCPKSLPSLRHGWCVCGEQHKHAA